MKIVTSIAGCATMLVARAAPAHPGHGDPTWRGSLFHYVLDVEHLPLMLLAAAVALVIGWRGAAWSRRRGADVEEGAARRAR
jgi:hypothetical protein